MRYPFSLQPPRIGYDSHVCVTLFFAITPNRVRFSRLRYPFPCNRPESGTILSFALPFPLQPPRIGYDSLVCVTLSFAIVPNRLRFPHLRYPFLCNYPKSGTIPTFALHFPLQLPRIGYDSLVCVTLFFAITPNRVRFSRLRCSFTCNYPKSGTIPTFALPFSLQPPRIGYDSHDCVTLSLATAPNRVRFSRLRYPFLCNYPKSGTIPTFALLFPLQPPRIGYDSHVCVTPFLATAPNRVRFPRLRYPFLCNCPKSGTIPTFALPVPCNRPESGKIPTFALPFSLQPPRIGYDSPNHGNRLHFFD